MTRKVLIADDDACLAETLGRRFEALGVETILVDTADRALVALLCETPDVAIVDVNMPFDDRDMLEILSTEYGIADIPFIVMTGSRKREIILECEMLNAQYVRKGRSLWSQLRELAEEYLEAGDHSGRRDSSFCLETCY